MVAVVPPPGVQRYWYPGVPPLGAAVAVPVLPEQPVGVEVVLMLIWVGTTICALALPEQPLTSLTVY